jgi:heme/copper-type cytochrome/quinol oxidase subunit 2
MNMRGVRTGILTGAVFIGILPLYASPRHQEPSTPAIAAATQVIQVTADNYAFTPSEIHVRKGTRVEFALHCVDKEHGVKFEVYPEGSKKKGAPGLQFEGKPETGKVGTGKDGSVTFVAVEPGTYDFKCSVFCGFGHGRMKGKLIVDPD